jgi:hypothetical protein
MYKQNDTANKRATGSILKSFRKVPEQHRENSHNGHCVYASGSTDAQY